VIIRDQHGNGNGSVTTAATTAKTDNNTEPQGGKNSLDSNQKTLIEFKKNLLEEQRTSEQKIQELNSKIDDTKKKIDDSRANLDDLRIQLKQVNDEKDIEYPKYKQIKNNLIETRNHMKNLDNKAGSYAAVSKSHKERFDIMHLTKALEHIEHDIQTKKLSKGEERKLVAKSKEIATKLHSLKVINKKEDHYRNILSQYESLKLVMNKIFDQKSEFGNRIGMLKYDLDRLMNLRESLYEERRKVIHSIREAAAKLEMVETQLNAIEFRRSRAQVIGNRKRKQREYEGRREYKYEAMQDRFRRNKENQERWNTLKEEAMKKMSSGEKLTFEEMKLIYGDSNI
jgi:uncharacterized coiled-coil DUF342 family protein